MINAKKRVTTNTPFYFKKKSALNMVRLKLKKMLKVENMYHFKPINYQSRDHLLDNIIKAWLNLFKYCFLY